MFKDTIVIAVRTVRAMGAEFEQAYAMEESAIVRTRRFGKDPVIDIGRTPILRQGPASHAERMADDYRAAGHEVKLG